MVASAPAQAPRIMKAVVFAVAPRMLVLRIFCMFFRCGTITTAATPASANICDVMYHGMPRFSICCAIIVTTPVSLILSFALCAHSSDNSFEKRKSAKKT